MKHSDGISRCLLEVRRTNHGSRGCTVSMKLRSLARSTAGQLAEHSPVAAKFCEADKPATRNIRILTGQAHQSR
jgi:hypothetical protein